MRKILVSSLLMICTLTLSSCQASAPTSYTLERFEVQTPRLNLSGLIDGVEGDPAVVLLHGNWSAAGYWQEVMRAFPDGYLVIAPDMRGFGKTEAKPVDITRGLRDFSDDVRALLEAMGIQQAHLVGWSLGGNIATQFTIDWPARVKSLTLAASGPPFGYGGLEGTEGTPLYADFAGSGAGLFPPFLAEAIAAGDRERVAGLVESFTGSAALSPAFNDLLVTETLSTRIGESFSPGAVAASANWPGFAPGNTGVFNAMSPKHLNQAALAEIQPKPPILWIRGSEDQIVSDRGENDPAVQGELGQIPGWPGAEAYPPQPMNSQWRALLARYQQGGGSAEEVVFEGVGHGVFLENQDAFMRELTRHLQASD